MKIDFFRPSPAYMLERHPVKRARTPIVRVPKSYDTLQSSYPCAYVCAVDIGTGTPATLEGMAFAGATRKNRPNLQVRVV